MSTVSKEVPDRGCNIAVIAAVIVAVSSVVVTGWGSAHFIRVNVDVGGTSSLSITSTSLCIVVPIFAGVLALGGLYGLDGADGLYVTTKLSLCLILSK